MSVYWVFRADNELLVQESPSRTMGTNITLCGKASNG